MSPYAPEFQTGGVANFTGSAKLHGTPSSVETIFNATQGKKLFNLVNSLPSVLLHDLSTPKLSAIIPRIQETIVNVGNLTFPNVTNGNDVIETLKSLPRIALQQQYTPNFQGG